MTTCTSSLTTLRKRNMYCIYNNIGLNIENVWEEAGNVWEEAGNVWEETGNVWEEAGNVWGSGRPVMYAVDRECM